MREERKKLGRFIKRDDPLIDSTLIRDFNFKRLCDVPTVAFDNPAGNLIYTDYHTENEIEAGLTEHEGLTKDLRAPESIIPVLQPIDFTEDWRKDLERKSRRAKGRIDDDEELEFDIEMEKNMKAAQNYLKEQLSSEEENEQGKDASDSAQAEVSPEQANLKQFQDQKTNLDAIGAAINTLSEIEPTSEEGENALELTKEPELPSEHATSEPSSEPPNTDEASEASDQSEFIPAQTASSSNAEPHNPEKEAVEHYHRQQDDKEIASSQVTEKIEEAKAKGYQEGYKLGEQKASLQLQQNTQELVDNLQAIMNEMAKLKKDVLENVQDNFYELCQAIAESLLKREFKLDPSSLASVIQRAIDESIPDDDFKVAVHPSSYDQLQKIDLKGLKEKIVKDENLEPGNFRIDSRLSVIDGNVKRLISDLLSQADTKIVDTSDKAS